MNETTWKEIRIEGVVIAYVDRDNHAHLKIYTRLHGKVAWVEVWTNEVVKKAA